MNTTPGAEAFRIETVASGRGRYRQERWVLHLTECKQKAPRKSTPLDASGWFTSGRAARNWRVRPPRPERYFEIHHWNYGGVPTPCQWCMNPHTTALAQAAVWRMWFEDARQHMAEQAAARILRLKERADLLERQHPYTALLKAVSEAWVDGDTTRGRHGDRRRVRWEYNEYPFIAGFNEDPLAIQFRLSNVVFSDVIRVDVVPDGQGVRVKDINHSTSAITEPNDARRLARVFDIIDNWKKEH